MRVFLGYESAWEIHMRCRKRIGDRLRPSEAHPLQGEAPMEKMIETLIEMGCRPPIRLVVSNPGDRRTNDQVCCHTDSAVFPRGSFMKLGNGVYCASPELAFVQLAAVLDVVGTVLAGQSLCGTFCYRETEAGELLESRSAPITSIARIGRYVDKCAGKKGVKNARRALRYMVDGIASPMEGYVAAKLSLSSLLGGYGLPSPQMNSVVSVPDGVGARAGAAYRVCDLFWPAHKVAVEYDSDTFHTGASRIARDSARRSELLHAGVAVVTITTAQFFDYAAFDAQVRVLEKLLGHRRQTRVAHIEARRRDLHRRLVAYAQGSPAQNPYRF